MTRFALGTVLVLAWLSIRAQTAALSHFAPGDTWQPTITYQFVEVVESFEVLPDGEHVIVHLNADPDKEVLQESNFLLFDLGTRRIIDTYRFNRLTTHIEYHDGLIYKIKDRRVKAYQPNNTVPQWKRLGATYYGICREQNTMLFFRHSHSSTRFSTLLGVDTHTGELRWEVDFPKRVPTAAWTGSDGHLYFISKGLHRVNPADGSYWRLYETTEVEGTDIDWGRVLLSGVIGGLTGGLTGVYVIPLGGYGGTYVHQLYSAPIYEGNQIYLATNEALHCIDRDSGEDIWRTPLPNRQIGQLQLRLLGSQLYLFNSGFGHGASPKHSNLPLVHRYDKATGTLQAAANLDPAGPHRFRSFLLDEEELVLFGPRHVFRFDTDSLTLIERISGQTSADTHLVGPSALQLFEVNPAGRFVSINDPQGPQMAVLDTEQRLTFVSTDTWKSTGHIDAAGVYRMIDASATYSILQNKTERVLIDRDGWRLQTFPIDDRIQLTADDQLYRYAGNQLEIYDLTTY